MWFDDDLIFGKERKYKRRRNRRRKLMLEVNTSLKRRPGAWMAKGGLILLVLLCVTLVVGLGWLGAQQAGAVLFSKNDEYQLKHVVVDCQDPKLRQYVAEQFPLGDTNLFAVDIVQIQSDLEQTANVKSARVSRRLPDTLHIELVERVAVARLGGTKDRRNHLVVDEEGTVFLPRSSVREAGLPWITGHYSSREHSSGDTIEGPIMDALALIYVLQTTDAGRVIQFNNIDIAKSRLDAALDIPGSHSDGAVARLPRRSEDQTVKNQHADLARRLKYLAGVVHKYEKAGVGLRWVDLTRDDYEDNCLVSPRLSR
jgi:cell division septal protein FtsQ